MMSIERVEVAMRARIGNLLCAEDPLAYRDPNIFRPEFKHSSWLDTTERRIARALRHSEAIRHYSSNYGGEYPLWVLMDVLDFSDISRLYEGLLFNDQDFVATDLGITLDLSTMTRNQRIKAVKMHPFARWLEQLTVVRNSCAHHSRVWNRSYTPAATNALRTIPGLESLPVGQSERVAGALTVITFLLQTISPGSKWADKVNQLIRNDFLPNTLVDPSSMGLKDKHV